jgi:hypothetical protein
MLKNEKGRKPVEIQIPIEKWNETKRAIREGIKKKLDAAKKLIETDKEVSAGLYIYAIEEFGKFSQDCNTGDGKGHKRIKIGGRKMCLGHRILCR